MKQAAQVTMLAALAAVAVCACSRKAGEGAGYDRNCRQYLSVEDAFHNRTIDIAAHQVASRDFTARNNELARKHAEADNALFRRRDADQASVGRLIRDRGGSIEIM